MKSNIRQFLALTSILFVTNTASASIISGDHFTDEGKSVDLQGLEWMTLDHTAGFSRNDIENGFTDRYGTSWAADDWRFATRTEVEILINSLWDGVYSGGSSGNADGSKWFIDNFGGLAFDTGYGADRIDNTETDAIFTGQDYSYFIYGDDFECSTDELQTCGATIFYADSYYSDFNAYNVLTQTIETSYLQGSGSIGFISDLYGANMGHHDDNWTELKNEGRNEMGSLLVRNTQVVSVPEPSTLAIFAAGIIGLLRFRKR